jgi:hypothetical protein
MAYNFLNKTTYSNDPLAQGDFEQFIPSTQSATPLGAGISDTSFDSDLIEMVSAEDAVNEASAIPEIDTPDVEDEKESDPQVDWEIMNMLFQEEPEAAPRARAYTPPPSNEDDEEEAPTTPPKPAYTPPQNKGRITPRIWQYGGKPTKYQFGGNDHLVADDYETQRIGLNDPNYNTAVFNTQGMNTFRGLDSYEPVAITDGSKYQILTGPQDTAKFNGKVYERKLKMQMGGSTKNDVKAFYNEYLNSPNYLNRLTTQGNANPLELINARLANLKGTDYLEDDFLGSAYQPGNYTVVVNPKQSAEDGMPVRTVASHEFSHVVGASQDGYMKNPYLELNTNEMNAFSSRNRLRNVDTKGMTEQQKLDVIHDSRPSESKADLDALRFRLYEDKIYNTGTQEFSPEILKQAKEKYKDDNMINRLFQNYSDDDLIYLMNNIAKNNTKNRPVYG